MIRVIASQMGVEPPISGLTVLMFRKAAGKKPKLACKAAEARYLLPIVVKVLEQFFPVETEHQRLVLQCVSALNMCYEELSNWRSDGSSSRALGRHARRHCILFGELYKEACSQRAAPLEWNLYPKHHLMLHAAEDCEISPKLEWNYLDESEAGLCSKLAAKANVSHIRLRLIDRYRLLVSAEAKL